MKKLTVLILLSIAFLQASCEYKKVKRTDRFKVLAWNVWAKQNKSGSKGRAELIKIIKESKADIILMVETYGAGKEIYKTLGYNFYLVAPSGTAEDNPDTNLSIFSKYPINKKIVYSRNFYLGGVEISLAKNRKAILFTRWSHYTPWLKYQPQNTGKSVAQLLEWEKNTGSRVGEVNQAVKFLKKYTDNADEIPVIIGGDFNSPSHQDWGESTKTIHNNMVIPWRSTKAFTNLGFIDSFREIYPDVIKNPGYTWASWSPKERYRIDYIFYKGKHIRATNSWSYQVRPRDKLKFGGKTFEYPSDHGFVLTEFEWID